MKKSKGMEKMQVEEEVGGEEEMKRMEVGEKVEGAESLADQNPEELIMPS